MKSIFFVVVMVCLSAGVHAQSKVNPKNNYLQKRFLDSLEKTFKQPVIQIDPQPILAYNTPIVPLKNEREKTGMSGEDTIYRLKTDNMRVLKPNTNKTYIPNAAEGKILMVPPAKKQP